MTSTVVPKFRDRVEELAFSLYASWEAGEPVSDDEYDPEVQQRFHSMIRRRRQGAANMCCVSGNRAVSDGFVLVDSGANEVLRPQAKGHRVTRHFKLLLHQVHIAKLR